MLTPRLKSMAQIPTIVLGAALLLGACGDDGDNPQGPEVNNGVNNDDGNNDDGNDQNNDLNNAPNNDEPNNDQNNDAPNNEVDDNLEERIANATITELTFIPPAQQRSGDPEAGFDALRYGNFVGSGLPYETFTMFFGTSPNNLLMREGDNATLSPAFNAFDAPNGARVVGGITCFGCHSGGLDGRYVLGLGDNSANTTESRGGFNLLQTLVESQYGADSPEAEMSGIFLRGAAAVEPFAITPFRGVNSAFRLEEAAAAWRNPVDLSWREEPAFEVGGDGLASDVPPWWNVKKKHSLYYNGMGRGDFARLIQQIMVVGLVDLEQAEDINSQAGDMLAWILEVEPPAWPNEINEELAAEGQDLFERECSRCHGTYGPEGNYPNLLVPLAMVGTDEAYARYYVEKPGLTNWYEESWFAQDTSVEPLLAYLAPPLDGIWASAPYFHNASVPTLMDVLDSTRRPTYWLRDFTTSAIDKEAVGIPYEAVDAGGDINIYDTTVHGYGNGGHTFGDAFSDEERQAVLEYLKTL